MHEEWPRLKPLAAWTGIALVVSGVSIYLAYRTERPIFLASAFAVAVAFSIVMSVMRWRFEFRSPNAEARARYFAGEGTWPCARCGVVNEAGAVRCSACGSPA